jgi:protein SCO1/2
MGEPLVAVSLVEASQQRSCRPMVSRHYGCALLQRVDNFYREPLLAIHISVIRSCDLENYGEMSRSFWAEACPRTHQYLGQARNAAWQREAQSDACLRTSRYHLRRSPIVPHPQLSYRLIPLLFGIALLSGCRPAPPTTATSASVAQKTFTIRGKILSVDATSVVLDGEAVPGFMEAMAMSYKLKDPTVVSELHPGDRITATVLADHTTEGYTNVRLDNIVVIAQARPDYVPAVQYHVPQAGDTVPDFKFLNQSDHTIHLDQFKGKVVLLTFIYTQCQLADFCPRMSHNFADIDKALAADPALYKQTHLLTISFDPTYDTPKVLRSYGGAYTGNYTKEQFLHWDFAAPPEKELPAVTQFFNVGVTPGDSKSLSHSLSTVLIGKDGKVLDWYPSNDWKAADVLAEIKKAAAA